ITDAVEQMLHALPQNEFSEELAKLVRDAYEPGQRFGDAFARILTKINGARGLIVLDPLDPELKKLAAPLYAQAAQKAHEIAAAIVKRSAELEQAGYHAQVTPS